MNEETLDVRSIVRELDRELRVRLVVYPKLISGGKLTPDEADWRISALWHGRNALAKLGSLAVIPKPTF